MRGDDSEGRDVDDGVHIASGARDRLADDGADGAVGQEEAVFEAPRLAVHQADVTVDALAVLVVHGAHPAGIGADGGIGQAGELEEAPVVVVLGRAAGGGRGGNDAHGRQADVGDGAVRPADLDGVGPAVAQVVEEGLQGGLGRFAAAHLGLQAQGLLLQHGQHHGHVLGAVQGGRDLVLAGARAGGRRDGRVAAADALEDVFETIGREDVEVVAAQQGDVPTGQKRVPDLLELESQLVLPPVAQLVD